MKKQYLVCYREIIIGSKTTPWLDSDPFETEGLAELEIEELLKEDPRGTYEYTIKPIYTEEI